MSVEHKYHKQLIFDLDTVLLRKLYGESYTDVYYWIRSFLNQNGFDHIEGSGYLSKVPISDLQLAQILIKLVEKYPFLDRCVKEIHSANVSDRHSWSDHFHYDGTLDGYKSIDL